VAGAKREGGLLTGAPRAGRRAGAEAVQPPWGTHCLAVLPAGAPQGSTTKENKSVVTYISLEAGLVLEHGWLPPGTAMLIAGALVTCEAAFQSGQCAATQEPTLHAPSRENAPGI
jgi:hypothetical protein